MNELFIALTGVGLSGGIISVLAVLTKASLNVQKQQGQQIAEWRSIVDEKDKQILRLESIIGLRDARITVLENRVSELERRQMDDV